MRRLTALGTRSQATSGAAASGEAAAGGGVAGDARPAGPVADAYSGDELDDDDINPSPAGVLLW